MNLKLSPYLYNPIYWHIQNALNKPQIRTIFTYGSSSAGKSYGVAQALTDDGLDKPSNSLIFRKQLVDVTDSIYKDFEKYGRQLDKFIPAFEFKAHRINVGSKEIRFRGIADIENMKGLASFKRIYLNELTQYTYEDYRLIRKRLRGVPGQQIIGDWNPEHRRCWLKLKVLDKEKWIKCENVVSKEDWKRLGHPEEMRHFSKLDKDSWVKINEKGNMLLIKTTYKDNYWIVGSPHGVGGYYDQHVLDEYAYDKIHNPDDYQVYALGNWGYISSRQIFKHWTEMDDNVIPKEAVKLPSWLDFGFSPAPTSFGDLYVLQVGEKEFNLYVDERIYDRNLTNVETVTQHEQRTIEGELNKIGFDKSQLIIADSAEPKSIRELSLAGFNIRASDNSPGSVKPGLKMLKNYNIFVTKRSKNTLIELENYVYKIDRYGEIIPEPIKEFDHSIDGMRNVIFLKGRLW